MKRRRVRVGNVQISRSAFSESVTLTDVEAGDPQEVADLIKGGVQQLLDMRGKPRRKAGDRVINGDKSGVLVTCGRCDGDGLLFRADQEAAAVPSLADSSPSPLIDSPTPADPTLNVGEPRPDLLRGVDVPRGRQELEDLRRRAEAAGMATPVVAAEPDPHLLAEPETKTQTVARIAGPACMGAEGADLDGNYVWAHFESSDDATLARRPLLEAGYEVDFHPSNGTTLIVSGGPAPE